MQYQYTTAFYYAGVNDKSAITPKKGARIVENDVIKSMREAKLIDKRTETAINAIVNLTGIDVKFVV